jgi:hypothetical protein
LAQHCPLQQSVTSAGQHVPPQTAFSGGAQHAPLMHTCDGQQVSPQTSPGLQQPCTFT